MCSLLQRNFGIASQRASVLPRPWFVLCCTLSSVCKTQGASSSSIFLCLFHTFTPFSVTASIPCYHLSPLFLVFTEMRFRAVNIRPSLLTRSYSCSLCFLSFHLPVSQLMFILGDVHAYMHILVHVPGITHWPAGGTGKRKGVLAIKPSRSSWMRQTKDLDASIQRQESPTCISKYAVYFTHTRVKKWQKSWMNRGSQESVCF